MKRNLIGVALVISLTGGAAAAGLALIETQHPAVAVVDDNAPSIFHWRAPEAWHPPLLPPRPTPSVIPTPVPVRP